MRQSRLKSFVAAALLFCLGLGAGARAAEPLTVFAAASLKDVLEAVAELPGFPGEAPIYNFAGSSFLVQQIVQGASADVFISADEEWMDVLAKEGMLREQTRRDVAGNSLVLIAPIGEVPRLTLSHPQDMIIALGDGRLAIAEPNSVPAGKYAKAALQVLGVWNELEPHLLPAENVRAALRLVATGEAPLGIVYASDAISESGVVVVDRFDPAWHPPILYPAAVLMESENSQAENYLDFLLTPAAQAVFAQNGFLKPGE